MSHIVREREIISQKTPNGMPWTEDQIRQYQESHGINYGQAVFEKGIKPNREWSNDRTFGISEATQVNPPVVVEDQSAIIAKLMAELEELKKPTIPSITDEIRRGVERHAIKGIDKRSKEYKEMMKKQA
jgi:hypothetical protein